MTDWKRVQGSQEERPVEFDTTSSAVVVYQRRNVERVTVENMDGTTTTLWEYEEREMSREEYALACDIARNSASITAIEDALCEMDAASGDEEE